MRQEEVFGTAKWMCAGTYHSGTNEKPEVDGLPYFPILRGTVSVSSPKKATLRVLGLGFFHCYINGKEVGTDYYLPLSTDYEARENYPIHETLYGHRIYVPEYEITSLLQEGENVIAVHFGGGWYTDGGAKRYGDPKAIYRIEIEDAHGVSVVVSSENDHIGDSYVKRENFTYFEEQDYRGFSEACLLPDFDDSAWPHAVFAKALCTEYLFSDCPPDRVTETLSLQCIYEDAAQQMKVYDCGKNISGWPVLQIKAPAGETITVQMSEERMEDGTIDPQYGYEQHFTVISDGTERTVHPMFVWFGFRYFSVTGHAEVSHAAVVHADVKVTSAFTCDHETLNWLYAAYVNTQLGNMHAGIPSDCPHIERRGYTGDGELACHAGMTLLDAKTFYRKWIEDISDCQDIYSGHVQYTAPYLQSGGGPGGWGCAIVEVPYQYYRNYGDITPFQKLYPQMLQYFTYLENHSVNGLVASDKEGEWCLGDWCAPEPVLLPAAFVNNYFYIKSMQRVIALAPLLGRQADIPMLEERIRERKAAMTAAYFNTWDSNFFGCRQGANAFAVDIGIGDEKTYQNLVAYYKKIGYLDTGIFGTDIVVRVLFEHGDGALATSLLASQKDVSFESMRRKGATTLWEYWPDTVHDRSHNHPMFGAVVAYFFDYLLGIREESGVFGYERICIAPAETTLQRVSGKRMIPAGEVAVSYEKAEDGVHFEVKIPEGIQARFCYGAVEKELSAGTHCFTVAE